MAKLADEFLPPPRVLHRWPSVRDEPGSPITLGMRRESVAADRWCRGGAELVEPNPSSDTPVLGLA